MNQITANSPVRSLNHTTSKFLLAKALPCFSLHETKSMTGSQQLSSIEPTSKWRSTEDFLGDIWQQIQQKNSSQHIAKKPTTSSIFRKLKVIAPAFNRSWPIQQVERLCSTSSRIRLSRLETCGSSEEHPKAAKDAECSACSCNWLHDNDLNTKSPWGMFNK